MRKVYLHYLNSNEIIEFSSIGSASKRLGISINGDNKYKSFEKIITVNERRAVLSFSGEIERESLYPPCKKNKININLALTSRLRYVVDHSITIPEIFSLLGLEMPEGDGKRELCRALSIPYYPNKLEDNDYREPKKIVAKSVDYVIYFDSLGDTADYFQTNIVTITRAINLGYNFPFWFRRYKFAFV